MPDIKEVGRKLNHAVSKGAKYNGQLPAIA